MLKLFPWVTAPIHRLATTWNSAAFPAQRLGATPANDRSAARESRQNAGDSAFIADVYRGLLGREPDVDGMRHFSTMLKDGGLDRAGLIKSVLSSNEFKSRGAGGAEHRGTEPHGCLRSEAGAVFSAFKRYQGPGRPGFVTNFLGALTDVRFVDGIEALSGIVEEYPMPGNFHGDTLEWVGTLRSALDARSTFTMLELGAGWAPWCVIAYLAAKQRGIAKIKVIGIEGDLGHISFIRENFAANGIDPDVGEAIHGVVGIVDGKALFPMANNASRVYGGCAAFSKAEQETGAFADFTASQSSLVERVEQLPCFSLATLMREFDHVDLLHCDIQGGEASLFTSMIDLVSAKVRRVVIGTHSFEIDRHLACLFSKHGWVSEGIAECLMREDHGRPVIVHDGVQVWRNRGTK